MGTTGTTGTTGTRNALAIAIFLCLFGHGVGHGAAGQLPTQEKAEAQARGAISGVVVDGVSGAPVADAMVALGGAALPREYQARLMTDGRGRFVFLNLPDAATYTITVSKFGHLDGGHGRNNAPTDPLKPIAVEKGAWVPNLKVPIWRPAIIAGAVRDETGEPVVGVIVRALKRIRIAGRDELATGPLTATDDHGRYRLHGLGSGRYLVQVPSVQQSVPAATRIAAPTTNTPEGVLDVEDSRLVIGRYPLPPPPTAGRRRSYPLAFHPTGATVADAAVIDLQFGEERTNVDVTLTPAASVRVSGTVEGPPEALAQLTLRLLPAGLESLGNGAEVATALVGADGSFSFLNVPSGTYTLDAPARTSELAIGRSTGGASLSFAPSVSLPPPPPRGSWSSTQTPLDLVEGAAIRTSEFRNSPPNYTARTTVTVPDSDLAGLVVRLRANAVMRGRILVETDPNKPNVKPLARPNLQLDPAGGQPFLGVPSTTASAAGEFEIPGIQSGDYFVRLRAGFSQTAPGTYWLVKSVSWRGRDFTSAPLPVAGEDLSDILVTFTNAVASVRGSARDASGGPPDSALVVVFPVNPALRAGTGFFPPHLRAAAVTATGTYELPALPAGDYFVAAIPRARASTWHEPEFLSQLERSATRISLSWGQSRVVDVTLSGGR
jgi:hypothetical protein